MQILRTASGNEYYCDFMGKASPLVLYIKVEMSFDEASRLFQNPEETKHFQWYDEDGTLLGDEWYFTKFTQITIMEGPCPMRIRLERDMDALLEHLVSERMNSEGSQEV